MENAGRAVAQETMAFINSRGQDPKAIEIVACCGRGNNGGDGLVAARHLKEAGYQVSTIILVPKAGGYGSEVSANLKRARASQVPVSQFETGAKLDREIAMANLLIDGILGTGSLGNPKEEAEEFIRAMTQSSKPIIAIDIPSGLNPDTGEPADACIKAALTLTLGLPKSGLLAAKAKDFVGALKVLDIGFPKDLL
jgi:NAD(P)H-hydrate epimerase